MTLTAFVAGAAGSVGEAISHALLRRGWRVTASMRTPRSIVRRNLEAAGAQVLVEDLRQRPWSVASPTEFSVLIFPTHLQVTLKALKAGHGNLLPSARVLAFSSNNVAIHPTAPAYRELAELEAELKGRYDTCVIIRPTLIYGDPRLPAVTRVMRFARRWPIVPLPGSGRALVQPIFFEDLAEIAATLAERGEPGVYAAGGPEVVSMRAFFERIVSAAETNARVVSIPRAALKLAGGLLSRAAIFSADQIERVDYDRVAAVLSPLPSGVQPRFSLADGLAHLAAALREEDARAGSG